MKQATFSLRFREENRDIFRAIRNGRKKVETRAATERYRKIKTGDIIKFVCGKDGFEKQVSKAEVFKTIRALLRVYGVKEINPSIDSEKELRELYNTFPSYREKIKKCGLIALELR